MWGEIRKGFTDNERYARRSAETRRLINQFERLDRPISPSEKAWEDFKVELKVAGNQLGFGLAMIIAYVIWFALLIWLVPIVWRWVW